MKKFLIILSFTLLFAVMAFPANAEEVTSAGTYELTLTAVVEAPSFEATDTASGITASADEGIVIVGTELVVTPLNEDGEKHAEISKSLDKVASKFKAYDIGLELGGVNRDLSGKMSLKIPVPAGYDSKKLKLFYFDDSGEKVELEFKLDDKGENVLFTTEVLGIFVLGEGIGEINTGEKSIKLIAFALTASIVILFLIRQRKRKFDMK